MAMKKYYAVKVGVKPGIYESWADCQAQINGYSGAVFKGFENRDDAVRFIGDTADFGDTVCADEDAMSNKLADDLQVNDKLDDIEPSSDKHPTTDAIAYVDGSYDKVSHAFSYGMVFCYQGSELCFNGRFDDSEAASMHNVAGELEGSKAAMQYCLDHGIESVTIYHDYEGIARWCTGEWKAQKKWTMEYVDFYQKASEKVDIRFVKVKGHSGDHYNDMADHLAKEALGIK